MTEVVPILRVADARRSAAFYGHFGFSLEWEHQFEPGLPLFVSVGTNGARLFLSEHEGDASPDTMLYLYVDDVDALYDRLRSEGIAVHEPQDQPWGVREISVQDADGNRLRIGSRTAA